MKTIGIIGGGIIGLSSAYYLSRAGHDVTVIDQTDLSDGCSFGNAGMIVPSHIIPLAAPGMIEKGIRWMFDSSSPFYIKPRFNLDLIRWGYHFYRSATKENVARSVIPLKEISLLSKSRYQQLTKELPFDFGYQERGLLMLYKTKTAANEEAETAALANRNGVEAHVLSGSEVQAMEPDVKVEVRGGIYFPGDAHLTPQQLMGNLIRFLKGRGVTFVTGRKIMDFGVMNGMLRTVRGERETFERDEWVIATGSWSGDFCKKLGLTLPMQAGKGYSFTLPEMSRNVRVPSILTERRVAVTPMGSSLRFGGTMEITGTESTVNMSRVKGIVDSIPRYYPEIKPAMPLAGTMWHGRRPCSPDGLPYIGRLKKISNVILATGHSMMGLSLGPGTGKLVSEIVGRENPSMDIGPFDPERFG